MGVINVVGTISPIWREQVVANPGQASAVASGGTGGTNSVTIATNQTGLNPGGLVTFSAGTAEPVNTVILSYVASTGVLTFAANLTNSHTTGNVQWGYSASSGDAPGGFIYEGNGEFSMSATDAQTPTDTDGQCNSAYGIVNQKVRDWDLQLRQQNIQT